jgi:hypothetical protein
LTSKFCGALTNRPACEADTTGCLSLSSSQAPPPPPPPPPQQQPQQQRHYALLFCPNTDTGARPATNCPDTGPGSRPWRWVLRSGASHVASFYRPGPEPPPPPPPAPASPPRAPASSDLARQGPPERAPPQAPGKPRKALDHASALGPLF